MPLEMKAISGCTQKLTIKEDLYSWNHVDTMAFVCENYQPLIEPSNLSSFWAHSWKSSLLSGARYLSICQYPSFLPLTHSTCFSSHGAYLPDSDFPILLLLIITTVCMMRAETAIHPQMMKKAIDSVNWHETVIEVMQSGARNSVTLHGSLSE